MAQYEIILLGVPTPSQHQAIVQKSSATATEFALPAAGGLIVRTAADFGSRDIMAATVALYFGGDPTVDASHVATLEAARIPVVPVLAKGAAVASSLPPSLCKINACFLDPHDVDLDVLCALAFECVGLLHEQRRIFVSYRRDESREVAIQLHDELCARGFDVFLDTHSIRAGAVFQQMLWHRLADCDIVIMLDTAGYFNSKWTKQEIGRTMAHGIHVLRLVWPEHKPTRFIDLSDTIRLEKDHFDASERLAAGTIAEIAYRAEALRSRSVAWRHRTLVAKLRAEVLRIGGRFGGVGAHHLVPISLPNGLEVQAYPAVGVPTAVLLNEIHTKTSGTGDKRRPCIVYDDTGLRPIWMTHLAWLDANIGEIKAIKVASAAWELAGWDA